MYLDLRLKAVHSKGLELQVYADLQGIERTLIGY